MLSPDMAVKLRSAILGELTSHHHRDILTQRTRLAAIENDALPTPDQLFDAAALCIKTAHTCVWSMDIWNAAIRDADKVFTECKISLESTGGPGNHLWLFQGVHGPSLGGVDDGFTGTREMSLDAIWVSVTREQMCATFFFIPTHDWRLDGIVTHYPRMYGYIREGERTIGPYCSVVAALYFLGLKITDMSDYRPRNKGQLRRLRREGHEISDIRVVTLRKRDSIKPKGSDPIPVDWSCRWIVAGHWRKQWYPSSQEHKPIYIEPFVKGPDSKPLRMPREVIYAVTR